MRAILQRVSRATVSIDGEVVADQEAGLLVLLGVTESDTSSDIDWLIRKIINMRIFDDANGQMNLSLKEIDGELTVVSQFTLLASTKKGNRPSYLAAAKPDISKPLYEEFCQKAEATLGKAIGTGRFGAMMNISLVNSGPVTISLDSKRPE